MNNSWAVKCSIKITVIYSRWLVAEINCSRSLPSYTLTSSDCRHFILCIISCSCSGFSLVDGRRRCCTLLQYCSISSNDEVALLNGKDITLTCCPCTFNNSFTLYSSWLSHTNSIHREGVSSITHLNHLETCLSFILSLSEDNNEMI